MMIKIQIRLWDAGTVVQLIQWTLAGNAPFGYSPDVKIIASGNGNTVSFIVFVQ